MTTNQFTECPNCGAKIKEGLFSSVNMLNKIEIQFIKEFIPEAKSDYYCNKCGNKLLAEAKESVEIEKSKIRSRLQIILPSIPVISTHSPVNWDYEVIVMVTGQSTTGTGVFSEFSSSFTDLFGAQSGSYNRKLKAGEDLCFSQLRIQAIDSGANAVIATDIDYSEVGGEKGMLMVCMAGTAVRLKNTNIIGSERAKLLDEITELNKRIKYLMKG
jgi:uncharacterized protein YbjQ (UPF0145 family)/DNA-directed RNA polymerase subunit RPC12/RpoP